MKTFFSAAVVLGLSLAVASAGASTAADRKQGRHVRHVRTDKTIVPAPMQVDTSAHPRVDMPPGMQGVPTSTDLPPSFTRKPR